MTGSKGRSIASMLAIGSALWGLLPGCSQILPPYGNQARPVAAHTPSGPTVQPAIESPERVTLAVVEEFLRRTQDYQLTAPSSYRSDSLRRSTTTAPPARFDPKPGCDPEPRSEASLRSNVPPEGVFANTQVTLNEAEVRETAPALPVIRAVSIRVTDALDPPAISPPGKTTNQPLAVQPAEVAVAADRFIAHLGTLAEEAQDLAAEWRLRIVQLALSRDTEAMDISPGLSPEARNLLGSLVRAGAAIRRIASDPLLPGDEALARTEELRQVIADRADPVVSAVALCRKVVTFGVYEEIPRESFVAGRSIPAIVYSEIRNLRSEAQPDGRFRTCLATRLEVLTGDGNSVWEHQEPEIVDVCRRRRMDFFIAQRILLPPTLGSGEYVLKVLVEDKLSGKANETNHLFSVVSPPSLTASR